MVAPQVPMAAPAAPQAPMAAPAAPAAQQGPQPGFATAPTPAQPLPPNMQGNVYPLTHAQVASMTPDQINAAWDQMIAPQVV